MSRLTFLSVVVLLGASFYQFFLKDILFVTYGVGRVVQRIEDFPYNCHRIEHDSLDSCEDIWLDDSGRTLYAACAGVQGRMAWSPSMSKLNISGRRPIGSQLIALSIDIPGSNGLFNIRAIKPLNYAGARGPKDHTLDLVGFDAEVVDEETGTLHFYLVNQRPPVDASLQYADPSTGSNATVEVFELKRGEQEMRWLRTVRSESVYSPNRVAVMGNAEFVVSNDHSTKVGWRKELDPIVGGGNVAFCSANGTCHRATSARLKFPNGIAKGKDGLVYVPSSVDGKIRVFSLSASRNLDLVDSIAVGMPLDNLATDERGDIWAAGFPSLSRGMKVVGSPFGNSAPSSIFRVRKSVDGGVGGYEVKKVLEDGEARVMSFVTTARHDARTGRLWLAGVFSGFLTVCEPK